MSNPQTADDMVGLIVRALKTALDNNTLDGFGSGVATKVYDGKDKTTGAPIEIKLKVEAHAKTLKA